MPGAGFRSEESEWRVYARLYNFTEFSLAVCHADTSKLTQRNANRAMQLVVKQVQRHPEGHERLMRQSFDDEGNRCAAIKVTGPPAVA